MATRPIVPQRPRGEAVVGMNKQHQKKNVVGGEGRSRRALGDIGNVVSVKGIDAVKTQRPLTRSFCAQLLVNAQAAEAAGINKKQVCANVREKVPEVILDRAKRVNKVCQKKVAVKSKPVEVIEISPDTVDPQVNKAVQQEKHVPKKNGEFQGSSKKTLSSTLTARSKAACGLSNKPKEDIVDIDAVDANNDLSGVEYVEDIYKFYKLVEHENRPCDYMVLQPEITEKMREILIDWLIQVHHNFDLSPEAFYLTVNIIDRFLSLKTVLRKELQLVGLGATLIASKYEEIWPPQVNDLICICDGAYGHEQVLVMEKTILGKLEWIITVPTHYVFLARFIKASIPNKEFENMVYFLAELGMMNYDSIMFSPSMVAASAVYAARCTLNITPLWTDTLKLHTGFSEQQLSDCAKMLVYLHSMAAGSKLQSVYKKYSKAERGGVATLSPATSLLPVRHWQM